MLEPPYSRKIKSSIEVRAFHCKKYFVNHLFMDKMFANTLQTHSWTNFLLLTLNAHVTPRFIWSIPSSPMDVKILEIGFGQWGVCQEIVGKTCFNTRRRKLIGVEVDLCLLNQYDIEMWLIYCQIQHCMPIVMGYDWHVMVEGAFLLMGWFCFLPFYVMSIFSF